MMNTWSLEASQNSLATISILTLAKELKVSVLLLAFMFNISRNFKAMEKNNNRVYTFFKKANIGTRVEGGEKKIMTTSYVHVHY